jgi:AAA15 family ATPase/GTPase
VLTVISATDRYQPLEIRANNESGFLSFMGDFLRRAGTGIDALEPIQEDLDFDKHLPGCPDTMCEEIEAAVKKGATITLNSEEGALFSICPSDDGNPVLVRLKTLHTGRDGSRVRFDFAEESSGTQRLMDVLPVLVDARNREKVYVIDELDRKLHPLLSRLFVSSCLDCGGECRRGQLIFTTHDSHLLDLGLLRRDEIWFLQKDEFGASTLYSLADLKVLSAQAKATARPI